MRFHTNYPNLNTSLSIRCNYEAVQYSHLKRHVQTHDVVKRFVCQHCNYSANTVGYMKIHYTRHHKGHEYTENTNPTPQMAPGTKVYRCLSCDYLFGNLSDIKRHLKVCINNKALVIY